MAALISDSDLLRVTNADRMSHRGTEKEIDWPSDYYSEHAARTFMPSETFHARWRWCQSKTTLPSERASGAKWRERPYVCESDPVEGIHALTVPAHLASMEPTDHTSIGSTGFVIRNFNEVSSHSSTSESLWEFIKYAVLISASGLFSGWLHVTRFLLQ